MQRMTRTTLWRRARLLAALVFAGLVAGVLEAGACELRLAGLANVTIAPGYNPFAAAGSSEVERFEVVHRGDPCPFFVTFSRGGGGRALRGPAGGLGYEIHRSSRRADILAALPTARDRNLLSGAFARGQAKRQLDYHLFVAPRQVVLPGGYQDTVTVAVYQGDLTDYRLADTRTVKIRTQVAAVVEVSLIDGGGRRDLAGARSVLDFGRLTTGETKHFRIEVKTNAGYDIALESENRGALRLADVAASSSVPYTLSLDGLALDLGAAVSLPFSTARPSHRFAVTIGRIGNALSGRYRDNILVTVTAR